MNKQALVVCVLAGMTGCVMNGKPMFGVGGGGGGGGGSSPLATVSSAIAGRPGWCAAVPDRDHSFSSSIFDASERPDNALPDLAFSLCHPDDEASEARGKLEARRQELMRAMNMTEADWASDYTAWHAIPFSQRNASHVPFTSAELAWSKLGPIDQFAYFTETSATPYMVDAVKLTETGRLGYLRACMKSERPADWAACQGDIEAFDATKIAGELRADSSRPAADRMWVRFALVNVDRDLTAHAARVKTLIASDATYGKLFSIATTARAQWPGVAAKSSASLSLLASIEDGQVAKLRTAWDACTDQPRATLLGGIAKLSAKQIDAAASKGQVTAETVMAMLVKDPSMQVAASAMLACATGDDTITHTTSTALGQFRLRGPRTAALIAIHAAELQPARRGEHIEVELQAPALRRTVEYTPRDEYTNAHDVISAVVAKGDVMIVKFPAQTEVQNQCTGWRDSKKVREIERDGTVRYERECVGRKDITVDTTTRDITVAKRYAAKLEAGRTVVISGGIPEAVYGKADANRPLAVFGVALP